MTAPGCELTTRDAEGQSTSTTISLQTEKVLGRHALCDVHFEAPSVSGRHARLRFQDGRIEISDMGSSYGTFIGEERIVGWVELPEEAEAWLGDVQVRARLVWEGAPSVIEICAGTMRSTFTLDAGADTLGQRELANFSSLRPLAPLVFQRERGQLAAVVDASGTRRSLVSGSVTIGGVSISIVDSEDELASIVAPRPTLSRDGDDKSSERARVQETDATATSESERAASAPDDRRPNPEPEPPPPRAASGDWVVVALGLVALVALAAFAVWILA